jgi:hypothetical protein
MNRFANRALRDHRCPRIPKVNLHLTAVRALECLRYFPGKG